MIQGLLIAGIVLELVALFSFLYIRYSFPLFKKFSFSSGNLWAIAFAVFTLAFVVFDALAWRPHWSWGRFAAHVVVFIGWGLTSYTMYNGLRATRYRISRVRRTTLRNYTFAFTIFMWAVIIRAILALLQFCMQAQRTMSLRALLYG